VAQNYRLIKEWRSEDGTVLAKGTIVTQREKDFRVQEEDNAVRCIAPGQFDVRIPQEYLEIVSDAPDSAKVPHTDDT
jgi:hypothetical protein